ncbi:AP-3 complex subunit delta-1 [Podochytrium sp. JEL0797]|nr:AP-3 complex subunit delta-1 [Podochytrium sp. JEL0797]
MSFFQKSLHDLIRGIRANAASEDRYIRTCLDEIRGEVKKTDLDVKATAIAKLFYLHMLGFDMGWAAFHVVEVMSSTKLPHKRIGYIAAAISFRQDTNVLMLCTNLIKKDLNSNNYLETALALNGLCTIVTPDLGRDLSPDLIAMMNHSRPYIRKRVILTMYKVFLKYPEALRVAVPRLKDRLEDSDPSVVSASVNVVCELARKNPKSYLPLAPQLFTILTTSHNNWLLIKIVKLFGALCPLEPRLIKKLVGPITNLIQTTSAMSLAYECILTAIMGGMISPEAEGHVDGAQATLAVTEASDNMLTKICVSKLKTFVSDSDQNLKYLGLFALCKLLPLRPHAVQQHRDVILECLEDKDISIRMRALELISSMVTKRNLMVIVQHLMKQIDPTNSPTPADATTTTTPSEHHQPLSANHTIASDSAYGNEVISRILEFCSADTYLKVTDFEWYVGVLIGFVKVRGAEVGVEVAGQLMDVCVRVEGVRSVAVKLLMELILDESFLESTKWEKNNTEVLSAAAWIVGEFVSHPQPLLLHLIDPKIAALPSTVQSSYVQAALKMYAAWIAGTTGHGDDLLVLEDPVEEGGVTPAGNARIGKLEFEEVTRGLMEGMNGLCGSVDLEVQERASTSLQILGLIQDLTSDDTNDTPWSIPKHALDLSTLFEGELNPVNPLAQGLVPVPEGLDLDAWIHEPEPELVRVEDLVEEEEAYVDEVGGYFEKKEEKVVGGGEKKGFNAGRAKDPYYIGSGAGSSAVGEHVDREVEVEAAPVKPKKKVLVKKKKDLFDLPSTPRTQYAINRNDELPVGVLSAGQKVHKKREEVDADTLAVRSVDLTTAAANVSPMASRLGWEVGRATLLTEATPRLAEVDVGVVRKIKKVVKVKKVKKPVVVDDVEEVVADGIKKLGIVRSETQNSIVSDTSNVELLPDVNTGVVPDVSTSKYEAMSAEEVAGLPTFKACVDNEEVVFGFDWCSHGLVSAGRVCVAVCVVIFNKSEAEEMKEVGFTIATREGVVVTAVDGGSVLKVQEGVVVAQGFGKVLMNVVVRVAGAERGILEACFVEGVCNAEIGDAKMYPFTLPLPPTFHLIPDFRIPPTAFADTLSNSANFPHTSSIQFPCPSVEDFPAVIESLAARMRLTVVEQVPLAASVYGRSVGSGQVHVAGVIKARVKAKPANSMMKAIGGSGGGGSGVGGGIVSVELKSGDVGLIDVLIEEVNEFSASL